MQDVQKVAEVADRLATQMADQRQLSPEVFEAIRDAGFLRHLVPAGAGGTGGTFTELMHAVAIVGESCTATAWCASLLASTNRFVRFFPQQAQDEVWAPGPDAAVIGSVIPFGTAVPDGDGWRLSGRWPFMSGIEFADWVVLCARLDGPDKPRPELFLVPAATCQVQDTWFTVGMRATGSNTVVLDDVPVPAHRHGDRIGLFAGRPGLAPLPAVNGLTFVVPALGAARGALALLSDHLVGKLRHAPDLLGMPGPQSNQSTYETVLARTGAEIDAAQLLLERVAATADADAITPPVAARNARDSAVAVDMLVTAVNRIFRTAGTSGQSAGNPLQRLWHDVNAVATHGALQLEPVARNYCRALFATA